MKRFFSLLLVVLCISVLLSGYTQEQKQDHIKWIDFKVNADILTRAYKADPKHVPELLSYIALRNGNSWGNKANDIKNLNAVIKDRTLLDKYHDNKYYKYYLDSYRAILGGVIDLETGKLTGFHPIAKGFWYSCFDDFGNSRGYGYKRRHLGHDLFGSIGAPIIAVESGTVTELGWNRYGGWRIGIRSDDTLKYYYYAHLRKDRPFAANIQKGGKVTAGQVIGYLGNTGYSNKENVNMKQGKPHLHFGIQIIFHPSQEDGNGEIWIDCQTLCRFLSRNRAKVQKCEETKEWKSVKIQPQSPAHAADY